MKGAIMDGLNMQIIKSLPVPLPPRSEQQRFAAVVRHHERLVGQQREALRQADHLFQSLFHRAFTVGLDTLLNEKVLASVKYE